MSILDERVDGPEADNYKLVITRAADWDAAIIAYVQEKFGVTWVSNDGNFRHILHRVLSSERFNWKTTRGAIDSTSGSTPQPEPNPDPDVPPPSGQILPFGKLIKIFDGPVHPRLYSYWANAYVRGSSIYVFAAKQPQKPWFWQVNPAGQVSDLGSLPFDGETEGWYWDRDGWINIPNNSQLFRYNPFTGDGDIAFKVTDKFPNLYLKQAHSDDAGYNHCATAVDNRTWKSVGTFIVKGKEVYLIPANQALDESDITANGDYVLIKEGNDNRIIKVSTLVDQDLLIDEEGAVGHSGMGEYFVIGEDNIHGRAVYWNLNTLVDTSLFTTWNMGHVAIRGKKALFSRADKKELGIMNLPTRAYTPVLTNIQGWDSDYDSQVRANLSPCGTVGCFSANGALYVVGV